MHCRLQVNAMERYPRFSNEIKPSRIARIQDSSGILSGQRVGCLTQGLYRILWLCFQGFLGILGDSYRIFYCSIDCNQQNDAGMKIGSKNLKESQRIFKNA